MKYIKKGILSLMACSMMLLSNFSLIYAEEDFDANPDYYKELCAKEELSEDEEVICTAYAQHISDESSELRDQLAQIEANREEIAKDIEAQAQKIAGYEAEISRLNTEINDLNAEISVLEIKIEETNQLILEKDTEKNELVQKVQDRMINGQGTMRLNQQLDFLMGSESFADLIRRINGLSDLNEYDNYVRDELMEVLEELKVAKAELETQKTEIENKRDDVEDKQNTIELMLKEAEIVQEEWKKQEAEWLAQGNQIIGDLEKIKEEIADLSDKIGEIPSSTGFIKPTNTGYISAGTWQYPTGGTHLGLDIAAPIGTPIYAVANGVIIKSVDGCANNGYLGNTCGAAQGGTSGGGNQVIMLSRVDGTLYAIKYLHLNKGSLVANYTSVLAGDQIASMGNSGNSTGSHLHIEVYKLGNYSINDFIDQWDGDLSFGCGWGTSALNRICSNSGAPCRMRPEDALGY